MAVPAAPAVRIEPLARHHVRDDFSCGVPELDDYLRHRASQDQRNNIAACYVFTEPAKSRVVRGYYTLSSYAIELRSLPADISSKLPRYPRVPTALLGRLAVDRPRQGRRLGEMLLIDAMSRTLDIAAEIGVHALIVDAWNIEAAAFYQRYGFIGLPSERLRLFLPVALIENVLNTA